MLNHKEMKLDVISRYMVKENPNNYFLLIYLWTLIHENRKLDEVLPNKLGVPSEVGSYKRFYKWQLSDTKMVQ